jgi:hypothetical protein
VFDSVAGVVFVALVATEASLVRSLTRRWGSRVEDEDATFGKSAVTARLA